MAVTCCELKWLRYLPHHLQVPQLAPTFLFCGNQATLYISSDIIFHECISILKLTVILPVMNFRRIAFSWPTFPLMFNSPICFTKALRSSQFHLLKGKLGLCNLHTPT